MIVEPFHYTEIKHAQHVRKLHVVKRLHAKAGVTNAALTANREYGTSCSAASDAQIIAIEA
jgi:hypothetical protein